MQQFQGVPMLRLFRKEQRAQVFDKVNQIAPKLDALLKIIVQLQTSRGTVWLLLQHSFFPSSHQVVHF